LASESWKKNLYILFIADLIVLLGFSFIQPFLPLYIQQVGSLDTERAAFWSGIAGSVNGIAMFFSAPLWGLAADRWGRKPMVLRAMFGGALIIFLTGLIQNLYVIVVLRFIQGLICGTFAAVSALATSSVPRDRIPFAIGLMMVGMFTGNTLGPLVGGFLAQTLDYELTFYIGAAILFSGGLIVTFFVREQFTPPAANERVSIKSMFELAKSPAIAPLLAVTLGITCGPALLSPILSLYIKELNPGGSTASTAGIAFFLMGLFATLSSYLTGLFGNKINLKTLIVVSCLVAGVLFIFPMLAGNVTQLLALITLIALCMGGAMSTSSSLIGTASPPEKQGIAFGVNESAHSLGNGIGPVISGLLSPVIGLRAIFGVTAVLYVLIGMMSMKVLKR